MARRKDGTSKGITRLILSLMVSGGGRTLFQVLSRGDAKKEEDYTIVGMLVIHILFLLSIPLTLCSIFGIIPRFFSQGFELSGGWVFALYVISILFGVFGLIWPYLFSWQKWSDNPDTGILYNHIARICIFLIVVFIACLIGNNTRTIFPCVPLLSLAGIFFTVTFPTKSRFDDWKSST